ncbi:MAG: sulfite exporter TauE/SafE family protein [Hyphomicrobiales bacterium]|nr:sulfite exporter TauE/SafE family protein [Hyphomicrobiales bacterium]
MEYNVHTLVWLPIGLGLLGFVEPCAIGGHLVFLNTQEERAWVQRVSAALVFSVTRSLVTGLFGAVLAFVGQSLIVLQTTAWMIFGFVYLGIGLVFLLGKSRLLKQNIDLAPSEWKQMQNPIALGLAFGFNIPACAAPLLFGLLGLAATSGTVSSGFMIMFLFGLALSAPLIAIALVPGTSNWLGRTGRWMKQKSWLIGSIFLLLGAWSVWFGLYVDPQNWSGK